MERIRNTYLPSAAIGFTLTILSVSVLNLMEGNECQSNWWILEVFGYIIVLQLLDTLLDRIDFRSYFAYFVTEAVLGYGLLVVVFGYVGNWFSFTPIKIVQVTVLYILILAYIHFYFYRRAQRNAEEINELLKQR